MKIKRTHICMHGLRTPREEIAFTDRPKIQSQCQIFRYGRSIFCLPHRPNFSDIFDLCLHWVSIVRVCTHIYAVDCLLCVASGTSRYAVVRIKVVLVLLVFGKMSSCHRSKICQKGIRNRKQNWMPILKSIVFPAVFPFRLQV